MADISDLPVPSKSDISDLPAPPKKEQDQSLRQLKEFGQGLALPALGLAQDIPYKPVQEYAAKKVKEFTEQPEYVAPGGFGGARSLGQFIGGAGLTMAPVGKGFELTRGLSTLPRIAARTAGGAATGGVTSAAMEPVSDAEKIAKQKLAAGETGAIAGALLSGGASALGEAGSKAYNLLNRAFGGDVKRLASALRDLSSGKASQEAKIADDALKQAQGRAGIAERTAGKQERVAEQRLRQEPGVRVQEEAGQFKPIGESKQTLGERIRGYTNQLYDQLKARREANAKTLKQAAFGDAYQKEVAGQKITDTKAFKNLDQEIKATLNNPVTGLSSESSQLQELARKLQPTREVNGVIVGKPISFAELDNIRRLLKDRSYGLPAEGFDAIGQIEAGNMAKAVEKVMKEFSPSIEKYINQYAKDSQPLRVFQSKIGKALVDEQLLGKGTNYAKVPAESIPGKAFSNRESFAALTDALGGNRQLATAEAKKYFASEMEGIKTADQAAKFIAKNRDMLKEVGMYDQANRFARDLSQAGRRAEAARGIAKEEGAKVAKLEPVRESFRKHESDILTAKDPSDVARKNMAFAKDLLAQGRIDQNQYRQLINASNEILTKVADTDAAKRQSLIFFGKVLGVGAVGSLGYYGLKNIGG